MSGSVVEAVRPRGPLSQLTDQLGSSTDTDTAIGAAAAWIRAILASDAVVTLARPDTFGRLRVVFRTGEEPEARRRRSSRRREAFDTLRTTRMPVPGDLGWISAMFPITCRGERIGVLEVVAPEEKIEASFEFLEVAASQLAVTLCRVEERTELYQTVADLERTSDLGSDLIRARSKEDAVRIAIGYVSERLRVPVAGWYAKTDDQMHLVAVKGLGPNRVGQVRDGIPTLPSRISSHELERVKGSFRDLAGVGVVSALDVGEAVLLAGGPAEPIDPSFRTIGSLLAEVLQRFDASAFAQQRKERLDMGLAWTAHELRAPLLGVRAALDLLLERHRSDPDEIVILQHSLRELDRLASTVEGLLAWAVGARPLLRSETDLVHVVEEAAESCSLEVGEDRVVIFAPSQAVANIDATPLRTAVLNLLRNAVAHANPGTKVEVVIHREGDDVVLSVMDEGPAIPPDERRMVFDPFARGRATGRATNGSGLGLFIVKRVVEAHGGRIWIESDLGHTTFHVALPVGKEERRFAS